MKPSIRYSAVYFAFNLANAVTVVYFPLHAKSLGFTPMQIALTGAASNIAALIGAPAYAALSHHHVPPRTILLASTAFAAAFYLPLLFIETFPSVMLFWSAFLFLNIGTVVMVDTRAVRESAEGVIRFERVRLWGSIGFLVSIAIVGLAIDRFGIPSITLLGFAFVLMTLVTGAALSQRLSSQTGKNKQIGRSSSGSAPWFELKWVFLTVALVWASHGAYYTYFSIYLQAIGWTGTMISVSWNLGVAAEIILFIYFGDIAQRFSLASILRLSAVLSVVRWSAIALSSSPVILIGAQALHAFSFGATYLGSIRLVQEMLPADFRDRGQGMLIGFGSGAGSLAGRFAFGQLATFVAVSERFYVLFWFAAALAMAGTAAAFRIAPKADRIPSV